MPDLPKANVLPSIRYLLFGSASTKHDSVLSQDVLISCVSAPSVEDSNPKTGHLFKLLKACVYCQIYLVISSILIYMFAKLLSYNCLYLIQKFVISNTLI